MFRIYSIMKGCQLRILFLVDNHFVVIILKRLTGKIMQPFNNPFMGKANIQVQVFRYLQLKLFVITLCDNWIQTKKNTI